MFKQEFILIFISVERKTTVKKFYALLITAGVMVSGVVGCGGEASKEKPKTTPSVVPAVKKDKEEPKKDKAPEVKKEEPKKEDKAPEVKKEEPKKEDKAPDIKAPEVKKEEPKKEDKK